MLTPAAEPKGQEVASTLTCVGFACSVLGRVNVSTPSTNVAVAASAFTVVGNEKLRLKDPRLSSLWM
jgi:hypothetical protein